MNPDALAFAASTNAALWLAPFGTGVVLGLGAAVPPGPVNLEIARRASRGGFLAGASVGLGAVSVDVCYALLLWLGLLGPIQSMTTLRLGISIVGIALMLYLGIGALLSLRKALQRRDQAPFVEARAAAASPEPLGGYLAGVLLCVTSPYQAAWWLAAVPAVLSNLGQIGETRTGGALLCWGVFFATLLWVVAFATLLTAARTLDRRRWLPALMDLIGGVVLLAFAGLAAWNLVRELL